MYPVVIFEGNRIEAIAIHEMLQEQGLKSELYDPPEDETAKAMGYAPNTDHTHVRVPASEKQKAETLVHGYLHKLGEE